MHTLVQMLLSTYFTISGTQVTQKKYQKPKGNQKHQPVKPAAAAHHSQKKHSNRQQRQAEF